MFESEEVAPLTVKRMFSNGWISCSLLGEEEEEEVWGENGSFLQENCVV